MNDIYPFPNLPIACYQTWKWYYFTPQVDGISRPPLRTWMALRVPHTVFPRLQLQCCLFVHFSQHEQKTHKIAIINLCSKCFRHWCVKNIMRVMFHSYVHCIVALKNLSLVALIVPILVNFIFFGQTYMYWKLCSSCSLIKLGKRSFESKVLYKCVIFIVVIILISYCFDFYLIFYHLFTGLFLMLFMFRFCKCRGQA